MGIEGESSTSRRDVLRGGAVSVGALVGAFGMAGGAGAAEPAADTLLSVTTGAKGWLYLTNILGESIDSKHAKWIDIQSFSWGVTAPTTFSSGSGAGVGKPVPSAMTVHAYTSVASPLLFKYAVSGAHISTGILALRGPGNTTDFLRMTLTGVLVTSYKPADSVPNGPIDTFTLIFNKIALSYAVQNADGTLAAPVVVTWDIALNTVSGP